MKIPSTIYKQLEDADRRGELILYLLSIESRVRRQECGSVLSELHNSGKISLVSDNNIDDIKVLAHEDFWTVVHLLNQAIPKLNCSHLDILKLVHTLVSKAGSDYASNRPYISLVKWCKTNPEKAKLIIEGAKSLDEICLSHCVFAIQALGSVEIAFDFLKHSEKAIISVGLLSLGRLQINSETISKQVIAECLKIILVKKDQEIRFSAIKTAFKIWENLGDSKSYRQKEFIDNIIDAKKETDLVQLSAALSNHPNGLLVESVNKLLEAFLEEDSNPQGILYWLDQALHFKSEDWEMNKVIDVFSTQLPKLDNPIKPSQFYNFCQWIWESPDNASQLFSCWLVSGQFNLCSLLADMLCEGGIKNKIVEISKSDLPNNLDDQIFMARKCVGFLWFHEVTAASILLSIVKNGKKIAREEAEKLLYNPLLLSYSVKLRSFLNEQVKSSSKRISDCTKRLIKSHDTYLKGLKQAELLVEFYPTIAQRRASAIKDRERTKEIQKQAHEKSVFSQLVTHQTLLYGTKSFSLIHGEGGKKVPSITPLSEISYSTEFPRLSVVDPVGFSEMLTIFRMEQKVSQ